MNLLPLITKNHITEPFAVTLYAPGRLKVLTRELFGTRSISDALALSRSILLQYLEQGHEAGMVELQGRGEVHCIQRKPGIAHLIESSFNKTSG